jgi:DNA-binding CsgD family transcriptional regulator
MPVRGRDPELDGLRTVIRRARDGAGGVALIEGEGGIGKTRLVHEIASEAAELNFEVFIGGAEELERERPFGAVAHALGPLRRAVDDLLWSKDASPQASNIRVAESLLDVIEERSLHRPVLLCIEDLHWADPSTLLFFRAATRRVEGLPLAVIGTFRPNDDAADLAEVVDRAVAEGAALFRPGPLSGDALTDLVHDVLDAVPGPILLTEVARAGGSPFYAMELVAALEEEGLILRSDGGADLREAILPASLRLTILRRLAALPAHTLDDLRMASMLGSGFNVDDLMLLVSKPSVDLLHSLEPAFRAGLLTERQERLAFRHDLVRAAIYEDIPLAFRKKLHHQLALAMAAEGRPILAVATHIYLGADRPDIEAYAWLATASFAMAGQGIAMACELAHRALEVAPSDAPGLEWLRATQVTQLAVTHRCAEAMALAEDLLSSPLEPEFEARVRRGVAYALFILGRIDDAVAERETICRLQGVPDQHRTLYLAELSSALFVAGRVSQATSVAREALDAVGGPDPDFSVCLGHEILSYTASADGQVEESIKEGLSAARSSDEYWDRNFGVMTGRVSSGMVLIAGDRTDESVEMLRVGLLRADSVGISSSALHQRALALVQYVRGEWNDALAEAAASLEGFEGEPARLMARAIPALIHLHRGDLNAARIAVAAGEHALNEGCDPLGADLLFLGKSKLLELDGDVGSALSVLELVWGATATVRYLFGNWHIIWPDLARLALAANRTDLAGDVADAADEGARRAGGVGSATAAAMRIRGLAEADPELLAKAAQMYETTPRPVERALAAEDAGNALASAGHHKRAIQFLSPALERYEELGATFEAARVHAALRALGVRRARRASQGRPDRGWESLTPTELRVIDLVAVGLTNARIGERLFISRRTAQTHLRNVFNKLGVASRAEVAAEAARRGA